MQMINDTVITQAKVDAMFAAYLNEPGFGRTKRFYFHQVGAAGTSLLPAIRRCQGCPRSLPRQAHQGLPASDTSGGARGARPSLVWRCAPLHSHAHMSAARTSTRDHPRALLLPPRPAPPLQADGNMRSIYENVSSALSLATPINVFPDV